MLSLFFVLHLPRMTHPRRQLPSLWHSWIALALLAACARAPVAESPPVIAVPAPTEVIPAAERPAPPPTPHTQGLWGVHLGMPLRQTPVRIRRCESGRAFAYPKGRYDIVSDDFLFSVPHEHRDSTEVLAALDSATACLGHLRAEGALVLATLVRDSITHIIFAWPDTTRPMAYDSLVSTVTAAYGTPFVNTYGVPIWYGDSARIVVTRRGPYGKVPHAVLSDARACAWFERLVHRTKPAPLYAEADSNSCWAPPEGSAKP